MTHATGEQDLRARVLIVENHPVLRDVVRLACDTSPGLRVIAEAGTGEEAVSVCTSLAPDVVLLDLSLPDIDGIEVARRIRREGCTARILVLTARADDQTVFDSIRAGVDGYLEKTARVGAITEALQRIAGGGRVFTPEQERFAVEQLGRMARHAREASDVGASITPREREILEYVSYGLTMRQIAKRLGLSPRTVEAHIAKLYRKLGVSNRVQAIAKATSLGLIDLG
jgi:DNA-binding NarL/FixJ family response regulator